MTFKSHLKGLGFAIEKGWAQMSFEKVWKVVGYRRNNEIPKLELDCTRGGSVQRGL